MLSPAFVARLKDHDAGRVPDRRETDRLESRIHQACVFEAITAAPRGNDLGMQPFRVEPGRAAEKDVEAFEGDAGDMGF